MTRILAIAFVSPPSPSVTYTGRREAPSSSALRKVEAAK